MPFDTRSAPAAAQAVAQQPRRAPIRADRRAYLQRTLTAALTAAADPHGLDLAARLQRCLAGRECRRERPALADAVRGGFGHHYRCRSPACPSCRPAIIRRAAALAGDFLRRAGATNEDASLLTVHLALTRDIDAVPNIVKKARQDLRNRRDAEARRASGWGRLSGIGFVELDALLAEDIPLLGRNRHAVLPALPMVAHPHDDGAIRHPNLGDEPLWHAHLHLAAHHPGIGRAELHDALARQWPGPHRVHAAPFNRSRTAPENAQNVIGYSVKFDAETTYGDGRRTAWPAAWAATHAAWLHGLRRGLQPLRITLGAAGRR